MSAPTPPERAVLLPAGWLLFAVLPVLPFTGAVALLELMGPAGFDPQALAGAVLDSPAARMAYLATWTNYGAMAYVQAATCIAAMGYFIAELLRLDAPRRRGALRLLAAIIVMAAVPVLLVRGMGGVAYQATFLEVRDLLRLADFTHEATMPAVSFTFLSKPAEITPIAVIAGLPFVVGVLTVFVGGAVAAAAASFGSGLQGTPREEFRLRVGTLQRALYVGAALLATSVLAIMLFLQLPAGMIDEGLRPELRQYARALTLFWGAAMTLTLVAVFVPAALALRRQARLWHAESPVNQPFEPWLAEQIPLSARRQFANLGAVLAPLLVGPLGALLQSALGGG